MTDSYKKAGVDIDAGERLVKAIGPLAKSTAPAWRKRRSWRFWRAI